MSCLIDTGSPIRWKKLTPWWPDCSHDLCGRNSENWPQGNRETWTLELKINCTWNNQDDAGQTPMTSFRMTVRADCAVSACRPSLVYKAPAPDCQWGESAFGQMSTLLPPGAGIQKKANFPFHQPGFFIVFGAVSRRIPLSVTGWERKICLVNKILSCMIKALLYRWKTLFV